MRGKNTHALLPRRIDECANNHGIKPGGTSGGIEIQLGLRSVRIQNEIQQKKKTTEGKRVIKDVYLNL